ncbi:cellulase family glycosylhydrolase [Microcoleus sp. FACHB-1515]|nr:cellulase family glycosylhydrolase [Microcoleus sp. FACHB-1515]
MQIWQRRLTRWQRQVSIGVMTFALMLGFAWQSNLTLAESAVSIPLPLSTQNANIIDANRRPVLLQGVNWFGMETDLNVPHGLWLRDYKEMLAQIKQLGYNFIRLPFALQTLRSNSIRGVDFAIGSNADLQGKTPLEVMDLIIEEADRQGLMILLDNHQITYAEIPELWYGEGFTEEDWINTWTMLADRYRNHHNVIGADLKNEPHGRASWGTGDRATDWRLAAERAGNAILEVNPNWLIVVEGVENNVPGQRLATHWMGGNLEGVRQFPVRLDRPGKLVYSPHEYGPGVFPQPWFSEPDFPGNLLQRWETGFFFIARDRIAPVLIGEFGGRQVDEQSAEGRWQRKLVDFIRQNRLSFAYWSWNPNSRDTGGILMDDWHTVDAPKQALLSTLLPGGTPIAIASPTPTPVTAPSPTPAATPTSTPTPIAQPSSIEASASLQTEFQVQSDWQAGFCVSFRVVNGSNRSINNWRLRFTMNQADISQSWNGSFTPQESRYTVTPPDWARSIAPNQSVDIGFCANKRGTDYLPRDIRAESI